MKKDASNTPRPKRSTSRRKTTKAKGQHQEAGQQTIKLMGFVRWTDPLRAPEAFIIDAPFNQQAETACVHLDVNLRSVASIEIRPARRPMNDIKGVIEDALRLANTPV